MLLFSIIMQNIDQKKKTLMHQQYQMENNEFKKIRINNCKCYCFDDIIKLEDFNRWKITRKYFDLWGLI